MCHKCERNLNINQLAIGDLTFMQQSECWIKWSFSLSEEKQFSIHCQDFNVLMAGERTKIKTFKNLNTKTLCINGKIKSYHLTILTGSFFGII